MKKIMALLLTLAMLLSLAACGGNDPNAGTYNAVSCKALGISLDCEGDWLELKGNGKGKVCLMGEEYNCSWTLEGENFTLKNHGDEFTGTLHNGIITLDYGDMIYVYMMDRVVTEAGETLGHVHVWQEADCENSKTCSDCGETEGDPLGHDATEANYQQPSVCKRCGITLAEKLQADMEKYGFTDFMEVGVPYAFTNQCYENEDYDTTGEVTVVSYEIFESAEGYEALEGYEWRVVTVEARFFDDNAWDYGISSPGVNSEDYYNVKLHDDTSELVEETDTYYQSRYTIIHNGQETDAYSFYNYGSWSGWSTDEAGNHESTYTQTWDFLVPIGYDGCVVGFRSRRVEWPDGAYITDLNPADFLLFRLN